MGDRESAQEARQKLISDWLFMSHAMRNCADSVNRYISFLASTQNTPDFLQGIIQLPNLHQVNPMDPNELPRGGSISKKRVKAEGEEKSTKRKRKEKDPNAPKRPASAYIFFQNRVRQEMREQNPDMSYRELVQKISERWGKLPAEEKKVYSDMAASEMEKWRADTAEYTRTGVAPVHATDEDDDEEDDEDEDEDVEANIKVPSAAPKIAAPAPAAESSSDSDASDEKKVKSEKKKSKHAAPVAAPSIPVEAPSSSKPKKHKKVAV